MITTKESTMKCSTSGTITAGVGGAPRVRTLALLALMALMLLGAAAPARAAFGISAFDNVAKQVGGAEENRAGAHPDSVSVNLTFNNSLHPLFGELVPDEDVRNLTVDLPVGFAGNPSAMPTCTALQLTPTVTDCPVSSQIGVAVVQFGTGNEPSKTQAYPLYNVEPAKGQVARFGFNPQGGTPVNMIASVRSESDYGVRVKLTNVAQSLPFFRTRVTLWGVPADPSHDVQRGNDYICVDDPEVDPGACTGGGASTGVPKQAFLTNPTACGSSPLVTTVNALSWQTTSSASASYTTASPITNCDALTFNPSIDVTPDTKQADAPSGLTVKLSVPQNDNPNGFATPSLRNAVVTLPVGMSLNAPQADGLKGCTDAEIGLHSAAPVACPPESKIGDVEITTPLLKEHLIGAIYLGQPVPGKTFRIFLAPESAERGVSIRLEGVLELDKANGLVKATFENNPQLPFSDLDLHFNNGPRAPLATPQTCGTHTATAQLTPWADPNAAPVTVTSSFVISRDGSGAPCPVRGFAPGFSAGLTKPVGGADSPFTMTLTRNDYDQELRSVGLTMPKGLLARIADVPVVCADAQANAGTCGEDSRIGSVTTGVGAGTSPFFIPGRVYVTKAYNGGPFGLSIVVPAIAGPFDLGTVVVRASIRIDKQTAQLSVVSDPLPTIVDGVPLRLRVVNVHIDRPHFMFAPSNCSPSSVKGEIGSTAGATASVSSPFQVANCARLPFKPRMTLAVGGKRHTRAGSSTPLTATVRMSKGDANLKGVRVALPLTLNAKLPVVEAACTRTEYDTGRCQASRVGSAVAVTPLLRDPLRGSAYLVKNGRALPDLIVALRGEVDFDLVGKVIIPGNNSLVTDFDTVPDVPITRFALRLVSGKQGPVGVAEGLCKPKHRRAKAAITFRAQNGKVVERAKPLQITGCGKSKSGKKGKAGK